MPSNKYTLPETSLRFAESPHEAATRGIRAAGLNVYESVLVKSSWDLEDSFLSELSGKTYAARIILAYNRYSWHKKPLLKHDHSGGLYRAEWVRLDDVRPILSKLEPEPQKIMSAIASRAITSFKSQK